MSNDQYAVEMIDICKNYGEVQANKQINLRIEEGEIHAIVGENGAGKTTLMNILYGLVAPTSGTILIRGQAVKITSPKKAIALGIGMVHQHFMLVPDFTVAENICLGHEPIKNLFMVDKSRMVRFTSEVSDRYGLAIEPEKKVADLSVGLLQRVEILKVLSRGAQILILDEPTAVLTPLECEELFVILRNMARDGKTIILITHKLKEVMDISDHVTVLRRGETQGTVEKRKTDERQLAHLMIGKGADFKLLEKEKVKENAPVAIAIAGLRVKNALGVEKLKGIDLQVRSGEIVTVAGVEGNGQTELVETLLGFLKAKEGTMTMDGVEITGQAIQQRRTHCSYIPEDRIKTGLNSHGTVHDNLIAVRHASDEIKRHHIINYKYTNALVKALIKKYSIMATGPKAEISSLSGGNQQKVVVARELSLQNGMLVVAQPSRGVDVGATHFIHEQLIEQRNQGAAILLVSTDLDEVFTLSDRIVVLYNGEIVASLTPEETTPHDIGLYMTGAKRQNEQEHV